MPQAIPAAVAWVAKTVTVKAVGTFLLKAAGTFALNKIVTSLTRKKTVVQERQAAVTTLSLGEVAREAIIGLACTGGSLVDVFNWGGEYGTDKVTYCIAIADHECDGLQGYYVDDAYYAWTGNGPQPGFGAALTIEWRNAQAEGWAPPAVATANGGWTATDRGCGVAHVWVTIDVTDEKVWPQGLPRLRWVVRGLKAHDPRNGAQDPADPATWAFTRNAVLGRYAYTRGIYATGRHGQEEHLLIGRGLSAAEAPPDRVIAAANLCDELVEGQPRYRADGVIGADMDHVSVEEMFAAATAGVIVQREGGVEIEPGQAKAAVVTITDADLVAGEPVTFSAFLPDTDGGRINTVVPRYVEPAQQWKDHSGAVRRDLDDIARDGGPRELTLALPLVTEGVQADRCAEIARRLARLERRVSLVLPPEFSDLEEGDWIAWTSDRYLKGGTVRFRVEGWSLDAGWRMRLSLREIASSVFGVADPLEDQSKSPGVVFPPDALSLKNVTVEALVLPGEETGPTIPAIRFRWGERNPDTGAVIVDAAVRAIRAEVRRNIAEEGQPPVYLTTPTLTNGVLDGELVTSNGVEPNQLLEGRLIPMGDATRPVAPSEWVTVSTGELIASDSEAWGGRPVDDLVTVLRLILQLANDATQARLGVAEHFETVARDWLTRLGVVGSFDPVSKTGFLRGEVLRLTEDGGTLLETVDGLVLADAGTVALVVAEQGARIAGDEAEAYARQSAVLSLEGQIAFAGLELRDYVDAEVLAATADLATALYVDDAISLSALSLRSEWAGDILSATSGLASLVQLDNAMALAALDAQARVNAYSAIASGTFVTQATYNGLASTVGLHVTAISGLQAQNNLAKLELIAAAAGGKPARLGLTSTTLGAYLAIDADQAWFGEGVLVDIPTRTITWLAPGASYKKVIGAGFGATGNLAEWHGPAGTAIASMTIANSRWAVSNVDGKVYYGAVEVGTGGGGAVNLTEFAGMIGRNNTSDNVAGTTAAVTVAATGKFIVEVTNVFSLSSMNGTETPANGTIRLQIGKGGVWSDVGSSVSVNTQYSGEETAINAASLNREVTHAYGGSVAFRIVAKGAGPSFTSDGSVMGNIKATYQP